MNVTREDGRLCIAGEVELENVPVRVSLSLEADDGMGELLADRHAVADENAGPLVVQMKKLGWAAEFDGVARHAARLLADAVGELRDATVRPDWPTPATRAQTGEQYAGTGGLAGPISGPSWAGW